MSLPEFAAEQDVFKYDSKIRDAYMQNIVIAIKQSGLFEYAPLYSWLKDRYSKITIRLVQKLEKNNIDLSMFFEAFKK